MQSEINPRLLKPHPKNQEYYNDLPAEKYQEIRRSIEAHGIRDPLKILPDFTVLAGHQRLRIALELGLERVPVEILDVSPEQGEYLLVGDNEERRQGDDDPIRKARRAKFLAEYWGVKRGGDRRSINQNGELKTARDVAEAVGVDAPHLPRLLKLNDLVPELQSLVSAGKLGATAAEQLAYLTPEVQADLFRAMGDSLGDLSVAQTRDLRKQLEEQEAEKARLTGELERARQEAKAAEERAIIAEEEVSLVRHDLAEAQEAVDAAKEEGRAEATKNVAELEARLSRVNQAKKDADKQLKAKTEVILDLNMKIEEIKKAGVIEKPVRFAEDIKRIQELESEIKALKAKPAVPEDHEKLKKQLEKREQELADLTRAQVALKDQYKIRDAFSSLLQDVGKGLKRIQVEIGDYYEDPEVHKLAINCIGILTKATYEIRDMISIKGGVVVEADFAPMLSSGRTN